MFIIQYFLGVKLFTMALQIPKVILIPIVIMMCVAGVYAIDYQLSDVWVLFFFGLVGYFMRKYQYPIPATVLGVILGPIAEKNLRLALMHSGGSLLPFFIRPISVVIIVLTILSVYLSLRIKKDKNKR
jgi:putative tricarboxylic transport membrane protein